MNPQNNEDKNKALISDDSSLISERDDFQENVHDEQHHHDRRKSSLYYVESQSYDIATGRNKSLKNSNRKKKKKKKSIKKILKIAALSLLGLAVLLAVTVVILYNLGYSDLTEKSEMNLTPPKGIDVVKKGNYIKYRGNSYKYKDTMTSILFMGVDKKEQLGTENGIVGTAGQADAIYLVAIDTASGKTTTFQVNRSTMCDVDIYSASGEFVKTENEQVCLAYAYGDGKKTSAENCIKSVRRIFYGLPIAQTYMSMDIDGINAINDSIGGVTVVSPVTYGDFKEGNTYELHGEMAENFVRSRSHTDLNANINRMERQKAYLNAFIDKTVSMTKERISTPIDLYNGAEPYTFSNFTAAKVSYLALDLINKGVESADIQKIPGKDKKGKLYVENYIDDDKFFEMIVGTFYEVCNESDLTVSMMDEDNGGSINIELILIVLSVIVVIVVSVIIIVKKKRRS